MHSIKTHINRQCSKGGEGAELPSDKALGLTLITVSILIIILYGYGLFATPYWITLVKITLFTAVTAILGILAWIGYSIATTQPSKPLEEIEKEITNKKE